MNLIQQVTNDTLQQQTLVLPDGSQLLLQIYFRPLQQGWFFNQILYKTFVLNGLRITNTPNMLYQFRNQLPFGLGCFSTNNREPSQQDDFSSGASKLYFLTAEDVALYTSILQSG